MGDSVRFKMVNTCGKIFDNRCFHFILILSGLLIAIGIMYAIIDPSEILGPFLMLIGIGIPFVVFSLYPLLKCIGSIFKTKPTSTEIIDVEIREIEERLNVKYEIDYSYSDTE